MENGKRRPGPEARRAEAGDFARAFLNYMRVSERIKEEMYWI